MEKCLSKNWFCCGGIALLTLLLWGQTVRYGFVWDDDVYIVQNQGIRSLRNLPVFFWRGDLQSAGNGLKAYRPLRNCVFAVLYALEGKETPQPWIFHLANVLWHAAAAVLLFHAALLFWKRLAGTVTPAMRTAALLLALGFAVHPVLAEAVCWAKCLDDLMAGVFVLASACALLHWHGGKRGYAAALLWFLLAAFSKESAVPFALAVFFILYGFHRLPWRRSLGLTAPFLLAAFFYAVCRHLVTGRTTQSAPLSGSYAQTLTDMLPVVTEYWRLLWGIPPFCADYNFMVSQPPHPFLSGPVLGGLFLLLLAGALAAWLWRKPAWRMPAFGLCWLGLFLLPVSNLLPMMQYMAERFLYLPLMGFLLALAGVLLKCSRPRLAAWAGVALIVLWTSASLARMGIWQDELTLFVRTNLEFPGSPREEQNAVSAIFHLPQMMPLFPDYQKTGSWQMAKSLSPEQAGPIIATLDEARRLFPNVTVFLTDLAFVNAKTGHWPGAVEMAELAVRQNPNSSEDWFNLAGLCLAAGEPAKARAACAQSLRLQPNLEKAKALQATIENALKPAPGTPAPVPK